MRNTSSYVLNLTHPFPSESKVIYTMGLGGYNNFRAVGLVFLYTHNREITSSTTDMKK